MSFEEYDKAVPLNIPELNYNTHKGQGGRVCIVGGSVGFSGAPYFSGITGMLMGVDLCYVLCCKEASNSIKSYSPELMVHPFLDNDLQECLNIVEKCDAVLLGPGLGRKENSKNSSEIIKYCLQRGKPLVLDADGINLLIEKPEITAAPLSPSWKSVILTPNVAEFFRLYKSQFPSPELSNPTDVQDPSFVSNLAKKLGGVTICRKGHEDIMSNGETILHNKCQGIPRRCGGQGDVLAGSIVVFLHWFLRSKNFPKQMSPSIAATWAGCKLTREAAQMAYSKHGRSTLTTRFIEHIEPAFAKLWQNK